MIEPWPFDLPPNCAVYTTKQIMKDGVKITRVFHDEEDHGWQFHHHGEWDMIDSMLVALKNVIALDDSILEVADLPPGWMAEREFYGRPWKRSRTDESYPEFILDWSRTKSKEEFYDLILLSQSDSPDWHGRNLDALRDAWVTGGINQCGPPYRFRFVGLDCLEGEFRDFAESVLQIAQESVDENGGSCVSLRAAEQE